MITQQRNAEQWRSIVSVTLDTERAYLLLVDEEKASPESVGDLQDLLHNLGIEHCILWGKPEMMTVIDMGEADDTV